MPAAPQVVYTSKPTAAGGPYRTLPGRIVFPGQRPLQSIVEPNVLVGVAGGGWCAWVVGGSGWNLQAGAVVQAEGCGWLGLAMGIRGRRAVALTSPCSTLSPTHHPPTTPPPTPLDPTQVNVVEYKALGFLPGRVTQEGEIKAVSNDTFEVRPLAECWRVWGR